VLLLVATALPLAIVTTAGATGADSIGGVTFNTAAAGGTTDSAFFGSRAAGSFEISGNFAGDGGIAIVTSNAPGVTFSAVADNAPGTAVAGDFSSTSATVPGSYSITVNDDNGAATLPNAFTVYGDPGVTSLSVTGAVDSLPAPAATAEVITGADFVGAPTVVFTSSVNGTKLSDAVSATGGTETSPATSLEVRVSPTNAQNGDPATPGTYSVTVINPDGGSVTTGALFTITGIEITNASPSAIAATVSAGTLVTITGAGFQYGAAVAIDLTCTQDGVTLVGGVIPSSGPFDGDSTVTADVTSSTSLTIEIDNAYTTTADPLQCTFIVDNSELGGNGALFTAVDVFGVGGPSDVAPTITASSLSLVPALEAGGSASPVTFTGTGFSQYTAAPSYTEYGPSNAHDADSVVSGCSGNTGTALLCDIVVSSGATSGGHAAVLTNDAQSSSFAGTFTVAGPAISSQSPSGIGVGVAFGTVVALNGTGFTDTTTGVVNAGSTGVGGVVAYVNSTTMDFVVTTPPTAAGGAHPATIILTQVESTGDEVNSPAFALTINAPPVVTSAVTYASAPVNDVGVGADSQEIFVHGTGFATDVKLASFVNESGVPDPKVTVTSIAVNSAGTVITAHIAIAEGDTNFADGYSVVNTDGGVDAVTAVAFPLVIGPGPSIESVAPSRVIPSSTDDFTLTGNNFEIGAVVTATANGTCSAATVAAATSITVSCTFGVGSLSVPSSLVVTNLDGGSATSAVVLPQAVPTAPRFTITGVHGFAVVGKWVTITITGSGFFGRPVITSSAPGSRISVERDGGTSLTIRVWTPKRVSGERTFTVKLANGQSRKKNYSIHP